MAPMSSTLRVKSEAGEVAGSEILRDGPAQVPVMALGVSEAPAHAAPVSTAMASVARAAPASAAEVIDVDDEDPEEVQEIQVPVAGLPVNHPFMAAPAPPPLELQGDHPVAPVGGGAVRQSLLGYSARIGS